MPSKVRFILTTANGTLKGTRAVAMLYSLAKNALFSQQLPNDWKKMSKVQRMKYLADYLPIDVKLTCIREAKHTRKDRSLYVKTYKESKLPPAVENRPVFNQNLIEQLPGQLPGQQFMNQFEIAAAALPEVPVDPNRGNPVPIRRVIGNPLEAGNRLPNVGNRRRQARPPQQPRIIDNINLFDDIFDDDGGNV